MSKHFNNQDDCGHHDEPEYRCGKDRNSIEHAFQHVENRTILDMITGGAGIGRRAARWTVVKVLQSRRVQKPSWNRFFYTHGGHGIRKVGLTESQGARSDLLCEPQVSAPGPRSLQLDRTAVLSGARCRCPDLPVVPRVGVQTYLSCGLNRVNGLVRFNAATGCCSMPRGITPSMKPLSRAGPGGKGGMRGYVLLVGCPVA